MLSIVIITCNRKDSLEKTILSCIDHVSIEWELIVVDNGSTDGTRTMVEDMQKEIGFALQYYYSNTNLGVAGARNLGYDLAKGEILYFIDDDAIVNTSGTCLDEGYYYLQKNNKVQVLSTQIWDELWNGILPEITYHGEEMNDGVKLRSFIGASHFMKKSSFMPSPLYPQNLFYGGEELYLSYYIYKYGGCVEYFECVSVEHHPSKKTRMSHYDLYKNRVLNSFIVKEYFYPEPYLILSRMTYWYRILKLAGFSFGRLNEVKKLHGSRYDFRYTETMTISEMKMLISLFGYRYLI